MSQIPDIEIVNVDGVEYPVNNMSDTGKQLVAIYNKWSKQEADIRDNLMQVQAAKETISRKIISQIRADNKENEPDVDSNAGQVVSTTEPAEIVDGE